MYWTPFIVMILALGDISGRLLVEGGGAAINELNSILKQKHKQKQTLLLDFGFFI